MATHSLIFYAVSTLISRVGFESWEGGAGGRGALASLLEGGCLRKVAIDTCEGSGGGAVKGVVSCNWGFHSLYLTGN